MPNRHCVSQVKQSSDLYGYTLNHERPLDCHATLAMTSLRDRVLNKPIAIVSLIQGESLVARCHRAPRAKARTIPLPDGRGSAVSGEMMTKARFAMTDCSNFLTKYYLTYQ